MFVLALVHTFPFIIYHIDQGDMVDQWKTEVTYWTGVAAIIPQAYLTFMSLPAIRSASLIINYQLKLTLTGTDSTSSSKPLIFLPLWYSSYFSSCTVTSACLHGRLP